MYRNRGRPNLKLSIVKAINNGTSMIIKACGDLNNQLLGKMVHDTMLLMGFNVILNGFIKCGEFNNVKLFEEMRN